MPLGAEIVRLADPLDLRRRKIALELVEQLADTRRASSTG
jgi:hypothetical protein